MEYDLNELNDEQLAPVMETEGAVLVTAGAGSGKTRLLTHRVAHLILDLGVRPYQILAITFTNKAAREMRERLNAMIPNTDAVWVSTFHSFCTSILRKFAVKAGYQTNFSIYDEQEKMRLIKELCVERKAGDDDAIKRVVKAISDAKNSGLGPEEYAKLFEYEEDAELIAEVFAEYGKRLKENNALDFDDLLSVACRLLSADSEARDYYADKFRYIHVDEFQDTNCIQYSLLKLLASKHGNIMVVGDEDQSIYGWRGADIGNIRNFIDDFSCKIFKLERNYRSTKKIVALANKLIKNNMARIDKNLWTDNDEGGAVEYYSAGGDSAEADYVVSCIGGLLERGYKFSDMAVLMRLNALSRPFEQKFMQYGIPNVIYGGFKFYDRKEIKDLLAYLKIVVNHCDTEAIYRVVNFPRRGIGAGALGQLVNYAAAAGQTLYDVVVGIEQNRGLPAALIKKISGFAAVLRALEEQKDKLELSLLIRYLVGILDLKSVYGEETEENANRKMNIRELINSVREFTKLNPEATLEEYLQTVTLYTDLDRDAPEKDSVTIATVHSAKGLEFKVVFVVGLEEGILPIIRDNSGESEIEEERRLMYVALTRARERLYLTRARSRFMYGSRKESLPSRFLEEMGFVKEKAADNNYMCGNGVLAKADILSLTGAAKTYAGGYAPQTGSPVKGNIAGYTAGTRVRHKRFGLGVIQSIRQNARTTEALIEFEGIGVMSLALEYAPLEIAED